MFISIPKEFFVPVLFGDNFILNSETGRMELDTERESVVTKGELIEKKIKDKAESGKIYVQIDDEYVNSMTGSKSDIAKKTTRLKDDKVELKGSINKRADEENVREVRRE